MGWATVIWDRLTLRTESRTVGGDIYRLSTFCDAGLLYTAVRVCSKDESNIRAQWIRLRLSAPIDPLGEKRRCHCHSLGLYSLSSNNWQILLHSWWFSSLLLFLNIWGPLKRPAYSCLVIRTEVVISRLWTRVKLKNKNRRWCISI